MFDQSVKKMEKFIGSWKFTTHDPDASALDNYMKAWGVGFLYRQMMNRATPIVRFKESSKESGKYVLITKSKNIIRKRFVIGPFALGSEEAVLESRADGNNFNSKFYLDDEGKLVHVATHDKDKIPVSTSTREVDDQGRLKVTAECNGVTVVRLYEKMADEDEEEDGKL